MTQIYEVPFIIDPLVILSKNTKDLLLRTTSGTNAEIIKDWKFDIAGNLTLPAGGNILNSSGGSILAENILDNYVTFTGDLAGNVIGNTAGIHTGTVIGNVTGNIIGNVTGIHTGAVIGNVTGNTAGTHTGPMIGNVTGNITGNITGNVTGNVTGNTAGTHTGAVVGNVTGNTAGTHTGAVVGNVTGDVTGNITGDVTGNLTGKINNLTITPTTNGTIDIQNSSTLVVTGNYGLHLAATGDADITFPSGAHTVATLDSPAFTGTVTGITKAMVGLSAVTNESKSTMFDNPGFTGTVTGVTQTMVGLSNVTNESKATMFVSPAFTGTATAVGLTGNSVGAIRQPGMPIQMKHLHLQDYSSISIGSNPAVYVDIPNFSLSITPTYANSKIYIQVRWFGEFSTGAGGQWDSMFGIKQNGTVIQNPTDTSGAAHGLTTACINYYAGDGNSTGEAMFLDYYASPGTTSAVTYTLYCSSTNGTSLSTNRCWGGPEYGTSTMTLWEIAQ